MKNTCENCEYMICNRLIDRDIDDKHIGRCTNSKSDFSKLLVTNKMICSYHKKLKKANKENSIKQEKSGLSVFDNYTCDGQISMVFTDNKLGFIED